MGNNLLGHLTAWDYAIVVAYVVILVVIGFRASSSQREKPDESIFLANKSLGWASIGFTMWGRRCCWPLPRLATVRASWR
jgi:SSS family solute:Na+ symporter